MASSATATMDEKDAMRSISGQISFLSTGDRAGLRRIYLTRSRRADGSVVKLLTSARVARERIDRDFDRWRLIAHIAAELSGTGAVQSHARGRSVGRALHVAGYSENRLLRLTAARGPALVDQVVRAARMLARAGEGPVDLWTFHDLVSTDPDEAEQARIRIAQDYYAAVARSERGDTQ